MQLLSRAIGQGLRALMRSGIHDVALGKASGQHRGKSTHFARHDPWSPDTECLPNCRCK
jgi:hypothetical protein